MSTQIVTESPKRSLREEFLRKKLGWFLSLRLIEKKYIFDAVPPMFCLYGQQGFEDLCHSFNSQDFNEHISPDKNNCLPCKMAFHAFLEGL